MSDQAKQTQNGNPNVAGIGATETGSNTSDTIGAASDSELTRTGRFSDTDQFKYKVGPVVGPDDADALRDEPQDALRDEPQDELQDELQDAPQDKRRDAAGPEVPGPSLTSTGSQAGGDSLNADEDLDQAMRDRSWTETGADVDPALPNQLDANGSLVADPQAPPPGANEANRKTLTAH